MSANAIINRKKASPKPQSPTESENYKKRRNRAMLSCLHCHTSKRMCDRKRPACARCIEIGLSGSCVYEADDPRQQPGFKEKGTSILKKVAELEGMIHKLKNEHHGPGRASESAGTGERRDEANSLNTTRPFYAGSPAPQLRESSVIPTSSMRSPSFMATPPTSSAPSDVSGVSAQLTNIELSSILQGPDFLGYEGNAEVHGHHSSMSPTSPSTYYNHNASTLCNCIRDPSNYQTMLELSLRLRKAAKVLGQYPLHQAGKYCLLNQCLVELDTLTAETLSSVESPHLRIPSYPQVTPASCTHPSTTSHSFVHPTSRLDSSLPGAVSNMSNPTNDAILSWSEPRRRS